MGLVAATAVQITDKAGTTVERCGADARAACVAVAILAGEAIKLRLTVRYSVTRTTQAIGSRRACQIADALRIVIAVTVATAVVIGFAVLMRFALSGEGTKAVCITAIPATRTVRMVLATQKLVAHGVASAGVACRTVHIAQA